MHHLASRATSGAFTTSPLPRPATLRLAPLARFTGFLLGFVFLATAARAQVLVSDYNLARVLRYDADGANPAVLVAPSAGGLDQPHRPRIGPDGRLYVASAGSDQILRYDADTGSFIDVFVAADSGVDYPVDFTFRPDGYLYVSSQGNHSILRYDAATGARDLSWIASSPDLFGPSGLVFDDAGNLYVSGRFSSNLARFDLATGTHELTFGNVDFALGIVLLPDGRLLAASGHGHTVEAFAAPGSASPAQSIFATGLPFPVGLELDPLTDTLLVANYTGASISRHALADGAPLAAFASGGLLSGPNYFTVLTPAAIPEPSVCAAITGIAGLLLASLRRKRTDKPLPAPCSCKQIRIPRIKSPPRQRPTTHATAASACGATRQ